MGKLLALVRGDHFINEQKLADATQATLFVQLGEKKQSRVLELNLVPLAVNVDNIPILLTMLCWGVRI